MTTLISNTEIHSKLKKLAIELNSQFVNRTDVVCMPILQGSVKFFADLSHYFRFNPVVEYVGASSYNGQDRGDIVAYKLPTPELVAGKTILLFDDILESGQTINFFTNLLYSLGAAEVIPIMLLRRVDTKYKYDPRVESFHEVFVIGDSWVFGYGMDDESGHYRSHPDILCK
jgi:hypoxanthine phosphoribosyltransferase